MEKEQDQSGWMMSTAQGQKLPFPNARPSRGDITIVSIWRTPVWSAQVDTTSLLYGTSMPCLSPFLLYLIVHKWPTTIPLVLSTESHISKIGRLQLLDGPSRCAGRVEVLHDQRWGTICDDGWDLNDANVVCRQLGCGTAVLATKAAHYGRGQDTIWLDEVNCTGTEESIFDCKASAWGVNNCYHGEDAGVLCSGNSHSDLKVK